MILETSQLLPPMPETLCLWTLSLRDCLQKCVQAKAVGERTRHLRKPAQTARSVRNLPLGSSCPPPSFLRAGRPWVPAPGSSGRPPCRYTSCYWARTSARPGAVQGSPTAALQRQASWRVYGFLRACSVYLEKTEISSNLGNSETTTYLRCLDGQCELRRGPGCASLRSSSPPRSSPRLGRSSSPRRPCRTAGSPPCSSCRRPQPTTKVQDGRREEE